MPDPTGRPYREALQGPNAGVSQAGPGPVHPPPWPPPHAGPHGLATLATALTPGIPRHPHRGTPHAPHRARPRCQHTRAPTRRTPVRGPCAPTRRTPWIDLASHPCNMRTPRVLSWLSWLTPAATSHPANLAPLALAHTLHPTPMVSARTPPPPPIPHTRIEKLQGWGAPPNLPYLMCDNFEVVILKRIFHPDC